jgi:hypothetical protein
MTRGWKAGRRFAMAVAAMALLVTITAPALSAAATVTKPANHNRARDSTRVGAVKPKAKKKKKAATGRLGKRDYAEFALLVLAPFVVMALFLLASGYRRQSRAALGP